MILNKKGGKYFLINLLSDFILNKIEDHGESIIKVVDFDNFLVVKGKTRSKNILNLSKITEEFENEYKKYFDSEKLLNTIDLIEYDYSVDKSNKLSFTLFKSTNPSYHSKQIENYLKSGSTSNFNFKLNIINEDLLFYSSSFPFGYSLNNGRLLYYYCKKIVHTLDIDLPEYGITFEISNYENGFNPDFFNVINNSDGLIDLKLKSMILENFNFDMKELESEIKKMDWSFELTNPETDYDFLKN